MPLVDVERQGAVARLWFNRSEVHNALSPELGAALIDALRPLAQDERCRVVVLGGRGPSFCAGADIGVMKASANAPFEANLAEAEKLDAMFAALAKFPRPVVGRIHGGVYGGGVGFCCACDIAVASDDARFGLTEVRLGILPGLISPYVLRRLGDRAARELMLTGERFGAADALRVGLVHHVVPEKELARATAAVIDAILLGGPVAVQEAKRLVHAVGTLPPREAAAWAIQRMAERRGSHEGLEGLKAFLEKRAAVWTTKGS